MRKASRSIPRGRAPDPKKDKSSKHLIPRVVKSSTR